MNEKPVCSFSQINIRRQDGREIVDYSGQDYRQFWQGIGKEILNQAENALVRTLAARYLPPSGGWFIDLGCGYGRMVPAYYSEERRIVLVDYALNNLELARRRNAGRGNIFYVAADVYRLPFRAEVFNGGIAIRLFQHVNQPEEFMAETARIFAGGAAVLISYCNNRSLLRILRRGAKAFRVTHENLSRAYFLTHPKYFEGLCARHGLDTAARCGSGTAFKLLRWMRPLNRFVEGRPRFAEAMDRAASPLNSLLGRMSLGSIQFNVLRKREAVPAGPCPQGGRQTAEAIADILQCPRCGGRLESGEGSCRCARCRTVYPAGGGIMDFRLP